MSTPLYVLILEDVPTDAELMLHELRKSGFEPNYHRVDTEQDYLDHLDASLDVILADYSLPQFDALQALHLLQKRRLDIPFIVVTGSISEDAAVECIKRGAADYLLKDRLVRLGQAVKLALGEKKSRAEKRRAREALRETNQFLTALIQASPLAIISTGPTLIVRSWNDAAERIFGRSQQEVFGKYLPAIFEGSPSEIGVLGERLLRGEWLEGVELRVQRPEGPPLDIAVWGAPLFDAEERIDRIMVMVADIAERKRAEEAVRTSEEKFSKAFRASPDLMAIATFKDGLFVEVNDAFVRISGYRREELIGRTSLELGIWPDPEERAETVEVLKKRGKVVGKEERMRFRSGEIHTMLWSGELIDLGGEACVISAASDITERKRAEEELRESEEKYRALIETTDTGYVIVDSEGRVVDANREYLRLSGHQALEEILGRRVTEWTAQHDIARNAEEVRKCAERGFVRNLEIDYVDGEGKTTPVEINATVLPTSEGVRILTMSRDITERKQAAEDLRQTTVKLSNALQGTAQAMALTVEARDPYTAGHQRRVADLARAIATEMRLSEDQIHGIRMAGMIHDVGKVSVPAEILSKPGRLTINEFNLIKTHSQVGYDILKTIEFPWPIAQMVLQHHERMDGSGYPLGLKGEEILLEAKIMVVADVVEAMASHRPYRPALGIDKALEEIGANRGKLYDPEVADACVKLFKEGFCLQ